MGCCYEGFVSEEWSLWKLSRFVKALSSRVDDNSKLYLIIGANIRRKLRRKLHPITPQLVGFKQRKSLISRAQLGDRTESLARAETQKSLKTLTRISDCHLHFPHIVQILSNLSSL